MKPETICLSLLLVTSPFWKKNLLKTGDGSDDDSTLCLGGDPPRNDR